VPDTLRIGTPEIAIRLRRHSGARRLVLRIAASAEDPVLTLPVRATLAEARAFALDHEPWLRRHLANRPAPIPVSAGTRLPLRGVPVTLAIGPGFRLDAAGATLTLPGPAARLPFQAAAFVREDARARCHDAVRRFAAELGLPHGRISLRDPRSRWGSCTSSGDLMFSWRLAMAPPAVLDYVAAHEVAHLAELNHSARFWAVVRRLMPAHAAERAWLRAEGASLHRFSFAGP
jgi:predicted metal-dependent hydrolase